MMSELNEYRKQFYKIDAMEEPQRSLRLGQLMTELEKCYSIPMLSSQTFNKDNKAVMQLYKEVSSSRNI